MNREDLRKNIASTIDALKGDPLKEGDKRDRILAAAIELMSQFGYRKTSVDEIAERAGIAKGTVYLYFRDKRDILLSLIRNRVAMLLTKVSAETIAEPDIPTMMLKAMRIIVDFHIKDERVNMIFTKEAEMLAGILAGKANPVEAVAIGFLEKMIEAGISEGSLRADLDPSTAARVLANLSQAIIFRIKTGEKIDHERQLESTMNIVLNGIVNRSGNA